MSNGEVKKVSLQDIQLVQNLIERCLQLYMSRREVVSTLFHHAKIEPGFTELVWQKLEAENQEFFRAYRLRLIVKDQILRFNQLIERQVELMHRTSQSRVLSTPLSNGSQTHSMHKYSAYQDRKPTVPSTKLENMHHTNVYTDGTSSQQHCLQVAVSMAGFAQSSNAGIMQGFDGQVMKTEGGYAGDSPVMFGADSDLLEPRHVIREASISPFSGGESSSQTFNETMLEPETNSFGHLGQMTGNFSFLDLGADFSDSTDILESYSQSPFMGRDVNFLDPRTGGEEQDTWRLDTMSEGFRYEGFGSE